MYVLFIDVYAHDTYTGMYILQYLTDGFQVRRCQAYLDSLSMDGAEVAVNCLCSVRSCATCWCPDNELADAHRGACKYRKMAVVMAQLDAERDVLLDADDELVGRVKDVKEVEKRLRHKLLPRNAWRLVPFFELFMCCPTSGTLPKPDIGSCVHDICIL